MSPREQIYQALFDLLKTDAAIKTTSRRLRHWSEVAPTDQPALFLSQKNEMAAVKTRVPTIWTLNLDLWLYVRSGGDNDSPPSAYFNPIIDRIVEKLMPPEHLGEQTLGGLVERCRIEGPIETDEGVLGDQAVVVIPVTLFVPQ